MKTMQEVQTLISDLQQFYTDVRLLDAAAIERIEEGVRSNPKAEDLCYACRHRSRRCHHCAVKSAFENHDQRTKLEYFSPDIVQVSAQYMEVDGAPYVLELLQRMQSDTIVEPDDTEALFSALSGYNTKLYHDPLTDMYNRRYYEEIVRGMKGPIGVALMDLDDFKVYNDTYGHHAGDMALKTAATIVRGCIRQTDALVRFGGDEFLLILPGIPEDYFKIKLEGICEKIHDAIVPGYSHMRLSTSIGGLIQMPSDSMDAVVRQADRLMYQAKVRKNCVVVSGEMLQEDAPGRREEKPQILIVDDSEMNRAILSEILCGDYRILEAADGEECLKKMQQYMGDIALVLLDLMMPKMNGFEVLDFMNRNHAIEDLPVIMISGEDSEASVRRAYEMGVSDYVARPFDARVVYRRVFNTIKLYAKQRRLVSLLSEQIRARERNTSMLVGGAEPAGGVPQRRERAARSAHPPPHRAGARKTARTPQHLPHHLRDAGEHPAGLGPARHRQDRHRRKDPEQARPADPGGVRGHQDPYHHRRGHAEQAGQLLRGAAAPNGLQHRPLAPRAVGRPRLPGRPERERDPHRGAGGGAGRRLRCPDQ